MAGRDFDAEELSARIDIRPFSIWRQRFDHLKDRVDLPNTEWRVGFEKRQLDSVDDAVQEVLELVWPVRDRIVAALSGSELRATLVCSVRIAADRPEYCLAPSTMEKLAALRAEFCLDIHDYS